MVATRTFRVRWISAAEANAADLDSQPDASLEYSGEPVTFRFSAAR